MKNGWQIFKYEDFKEFADIIDIKNYRDTCDAWTIKFNNIYCIFYKHSNNIAKLRFSVAHEFGHILLSHLNELNESELEKEANMFAARILMPACVLKECHTYSPAAISELCKTTYRSAEIRANRLQILLKRDKFYTSYLERRVYYKFKGFIKEYNKG